MRVQRTARFTSEIRLIVSPRSGPVLFLVDLQTKSHKIKNYIVFPMRPNDINNTHTHTCRRFINIHVRLVIISLMWSNRAAHTYFPGDVPTGRCGRGRLQNPSGEKQQQRRSSSVRLHRRNCPIPGRLTSNERASYRLSQLITSRN